MQYIALSSSTIRGLLSCAEFSSKYRCQEVCAVNELPDCQLNQLPAIFIVNTDPNFKSGSHWVVIHLPHSKSKYKPSFFDPLGNAPSHYSSFLVKFLKHNSSSYYINKKSIQPMNSTTCGFYCIAFAYTIMEGKLSGEEVCSMLADKSEIDILNMASKFVSKC